ncbi:MAG: glycosyltransferase family 2 protein [Microscillaceae bacterium]|nr:glycosyltransferase family 2 protein [Microscillaceae bacterium]
MFEPKKVNSIKNTNPSSSSISLSAVIITKNEEKNIARCLDSLLGIADEILVVDSFSSDKTEEICRQRCVRFIQHSFEGHIEQKNFALGQTIHPYVLSLDADEALDEELKKSILAIKKNWVSDGYSMNRLTNYCGKWIKFGNWYPDTKLRLWDKAQGEWGGLNPHDQVIMKPKAKVQKLKGHLLHYSFYSIEDHILKMNNLSGISARAYFEHGKRASWLHILLSPLLSFIKGYWIKAGFRSGFYGFVIAMIDAHFAFIKYVKLRELQKNSKKMPDSTI